MGSDGTFSLRDPSKSWMYLFLSLSLSSLLSLSSCQLCITAKVDAENGAITKLCYVTNYRYEQGF
jgi:hypothetical protein